ncbi:putative metal-sulfur cluster biosynthetic enzyme [Rhizobium leguminosarum bv. trifolii WSM597]|uniref:Putative metal-sulfur cluster biosynthetic enzyme n=1 Tax=Rhizobium leguminosarum bv. trifolii WSM597 TaxID=754764 RepID=U5FCH7_RHILT|nr:metal-sulfur cluster assembly factor [Rhizobium leguminosarum]EJB05963.1 putative metal-sulfur cluster biosynthetic enzyme [Rhizobium leguminosarum bv. trifolii WSM597]
MPATDVTKEQVFAALREIEDPEVETNLVDLGLIYQIDTTAVGVVKIEMTTTTRFCPASAFIIEAVRTRVGTIAGVGEVVIDLVYDPPWSPEMATLFSFEHQT